MDRGAWQDTVHGHSWSWIYNDSVFKLKMSFHGSFMLGILVSNFSIHKSIRYLWIPEGWIFSGLKFSVNYFCEGCCSSFTVLTDYLWKDNDFCTEGVMRTSIPCWGEAVCFLVVSCLSYHSFWQFFGKKKKKNLCFTLERERFCLMMVGRIMTFPAPTNIHTIWSFWIVMWQKWIKVANQLTFK